MNFEDRWVFSMLIGTSTLFVLVAITGPGEAWLDLLQTWIAIVAINSLRLTFIKNTGE